MQPDQPSQRRQLGAFLRARREALPAPDAGRRRTPGLRREEVAAASHVSTTWYVWAEQGRDISLSPHALARLAIALRLSTAERAYMFALAARLDPDPPHEALAHEVPEDLQALPAAILSPAYLLDSCYNGSHWNEPAQALFAPWRMSGEPNLLRYVFLHDSARDFIDDWPARAARLAAEFRAETAHAPEDPERRRLIASLRRDSPDFTRCWDRFAVLARAGGERIFRTPAGDRHHYTQHNFAPVNHPGFRLVILTLMPHPAPGR
jgi:transcriptional regulator with XRE-family HTH domain